MNATLTTPALSVNRVKAGLVSRENRRRFLSIAGIVASVPLLIPAPFIFACIAWYVLRSLTATHLPLTTLFWIAAAVIIPLSFLTELRTHGAFLSRAVAEAGPITPITGLEAAAAAVAMGMGRPLTGAVALMNPRLSTAGIAELMLTGPRWMLGGIRALRLDWRMRTISRDRAAKILSDLLALSSGTDPKKLAQHGESMDAMDPVLAYLVSFGWIGMTTTMDRVYVYSESREALAA